MPRDHLPLRRGLEEQMMNRRFTVHAAEIKSASFLFPKL
jgi:hypothetical protein